MELQKVFKKSYMESLRRNIHISDYQGETFPFDPSKVKSLANLYKPEGLLDRLDPDDDFTTAVELYKAYDSVTPLLASLPDLWVYLSHADLFPYVQKRWPKVLMDDVDEKYILINKAVHFEKNQPHLKPTKNSEQRKVPIFNILFDTLKSMSDTHKKSDYIFPNRLGEMMSETSIKKKLTNVLNGLNKDLKEEDKIKFTLHQLRHTYVCILHKAGIDIKQAQVWTGHKDVKVLLNIYTHLDSQDNQRSIDIVNQFLA